MVAIAFQGNEYECRESETVLDTLLREGVAVSHSCRSGQCLACILRGLDGLVPAEAQAPLCETMRQQGYFLACRCRPESTLAVSLPDEVALYTRATVAEIDFLAPQVRRLRLLPEIPFAYAPGQYIALHRADGITRSYSLASVPGLDASLEIHIKRRNRGLMSTWIFDDLKPGDTVDIQGPNGTSVYEPGQRSQPLLLIGNGPGLAPLYGIARAALTAGHDGPIYLYHGSRYAGGLYLREELTALVAAHGNFRYTPCLSGPVAVPGCRPHRAEESAFADHPNLAGWRVFLSGNPPMVEGARQRARQAGADPADIRGDAFTLRELRQAPRL